jgi:hypothetical protein
MVGKWITIEELEHSYNRALGIDAISSDQPIGSVGFRSAAEVNAEAHYQFCLLASKAGFSGILRFQGKESRNEKQAERPMEFIPDTYFYLTRGFEGNTLMPFAYGQPTRDYLRQRRSLDPYYHDVIVERASVQIWLDTIALPHQQIDLVPNKGSEGSRSKFESKADLLVTQTQGAITEIWPDGGVCRERAKDRNKKIFEWFKDRGRHQPSPRTINRALKELRAK